MLSSTRRPHQPSEMDADGKLFQCALFLGTGVVTTCSNQMLMYHGAASAKASPCVRRESTPSTCYVLLPADPASLLIPFANYFGLVLYGVFDMMFNRNPERSERRPGKDTEEGLLSPKQSPATPKQRLAPGSARLRCEFRPIFNIHDNCSTKY